ncbi:hypothetical protein MKY48_08640 [Paenibacillus sp. FSL W8-0187]|uniref:hypothetical protein n=1 Tax=Paenibacillus sp. FSL W8-0187 TaxID=2921710 RepID=UPI0030D814A5
MIDWIFNNKEWVFSGVGISIISLITFFLKKGKEKSNSSQTITSGNNSYNIQGGSDVNITIGDKDAGK